jgi:lipopolysaccharide export system protein LptC
MIRSFTKALSLLVLCAATFSACKKDKNDDSLAVTKENLVGTYTIASIKASASGSGEQDVTSTFLQSCQKDDQYILKSDLTMEYKDAGTACSPAGDDTGTWSVSGSKITIDGSEETVKTLTKGTLVTEWTDNSSGMTLTIKTTYSRK